MILKRGDWIHLAMPVHTGIQKDADAVHKTMSDAYAAMGITVAVFSWSSQLTHPVIVSVMKRDE